jgi:dihydrolipoamide dehydrogenase
MVDPDITALFKRKLSKAGVTFHLSSKVTQIDGTKVLFTDASGNEQTLDTEKILLSIGVVPNTQGLELDRVGVRTEKGAIVTDDKLRTNIPGIYAAGDVNGLWMLAHKASREAEVAADTMAGKDVRMRYQAIPSCVYTSPEIAWVGLSEHAAKEQGKKFRVGHYDLVANGRFLGENEGERGFVKALVGEEYGELLGLHLFAPYASEIITVGTQGIEAELLLADFDETVFPHPTICESVREAILSTQEAE